MRDARPIVTYGTVRGCGGDGGTSSGGSMKHDSPRRRPERPRGMCEASASQGGGNARASPASICRSSVCARRCSAALAWDGGRNGPGEEADEQGAAAPDTSRPVEDGLDCPPSRVLPLSRRLAVPADGRPRSRRACAPECVLCRPTAAARACPTQSEAQLAAPARKSHRPHCCTLPRACGDARGRIRTAAALVKGARRRRLVAARAHAQRGLAERVLGQREDTKNGG